MRIFGLILISAMLFLHGSFTAAAEESAPRPQNIYLYVDSNATESSSSFDAAGGREIFFVDTNASDYSVTGLPSWCVLENKSRTSFILVCTSNPGDARSFVFHVTAGPKTVKINVSQAETAGVELSSTGWVAAMDKLLEKATKTYRNADGNADRFKGGLNSAGKRHGFGIYKWFDGSCYLGEYDNGTRSGQGIYLVGGSNFQFGACEGCMVYVGGYSAGKASGEGTCYDEYGRAIYRGRFSAGSPSDLYPGKGNYSDYRFEWKEVSEGVYFGETVKGVPNGLGIFIADDGSAWLGYFKDGQRGKGIDL
ncbi:MAG: hypothetical protein J6X25_02290 [Bacteroidales bacterium]|nr:hypothetical protein [Bacteroidales bacterium]